MIEKGILATYIGRGVSTLSTLAFTPIYVYLLGVDAFSYLASHAIIFTFVSLADFGMSATFSREVARCSVNEATKETLFTFERTLLLFSVVATLLAIGAICIFSGGSFRSRGYDTCTFGLMAASIPIQTCSNLYLAGLNGLQLHQRSAGIQSLSAVLRNWIAIPLLCVFPFTATYFAWHLFCCLTIALYSRSLLLRAFALPATTLGVFSITPVRKLYAISLLMFLLSILSCTNSQIDKLFASIVLSKSDFSLYTLACSIATIPYTLISPLFAVLQPKFFNLFYNRNFEAMSVAFEKSSLAVSAIAFTCLILQVLCAEELLVAWTQSVTVTVDLKVTYITLSVANAFLSAAAVPYAFNLAAANIRSSLVTGAIAPTLSIVFTYVLFYNYGLPGIAVPWLVFCATAYIVQSLCAVKSSSYCGCNWSYIRKCILMPFFAALVPCVFAMTLLNFLGGGRLFLFSITVTAVLLALAPALAVIVLSNRNTRKQNSLPGNLD